MGLMALSQNYGVRNNLSVAIVAMVARNESSVEYDSYECPVRHNDSEIEKTYVSIQ